VTFYRQHGKRLLDAVLGSLGIVAVSPLLVLSAVTIRIFLGTPVVFRQTRIGWKNREFTFLKFRTMTEQRDANGDLMPDEVRLTSFGRFLRSTSLDELPQLWLVVTGEMSLIGPRPLLPEYLPRYSAHQRRRHEVRPGITGWAQVNGRNDLCWQAKFDYDVWYVDHCSLLLDLRILLLTFRSVLARRGINRSGHATAPPFLGNR
jgi:lipopolysaccharide/colanic/teichoic acid biosynthesis glycosyltransferase